MAKLANSRLAHETENRFFDQLCYSIEEYIKENLRLKITTKKDGIKSIMRIMDSLNAVYNRTDW